MALQVFDGIDSAENKQFNDCKNKYQCREQAL